MNYFKFFFFHTFLFLLSRTSWTQDLILINGTSCSGKSSLAHSLLKIMQERRPQAAWVHRSIDAYVQGLDAESNRRIARMAQAHNLSWEGAMFDDFHREIKEEIKQGKHVIVDHCFMYDAAFRNALYHFQGIPVYFVKVETSWKKALERWELRNQSPDQTEHRDLGCLLQHYGEAEIPDFTKKILDVTLSSKWGHPIHQDKVYHLEISSSEHSAKDLANFLFESYAQDSGFLQPGNFSRQNLKLSFWGQKNSNDFSQDISDKRDKRPREMRVGGFLYFFNEEKGYWIKRDDQNYFKEYPSNQSK